jgi:hypothetical protein
MPGITLVRYRSELSVATKSSKQPPLDTSGSDLGQLPYCYVRLGEIARRCAPRPFGTAVALRRRPTWPAAKLSNSACLSAGSSNHDTELSEPAKGFQARNIMVRPERFDLRERI